MHVLIHQQKTDPATARDLVSFWAKANGCARTSISGAQPDKIVQVLYNGTKEAGGSKYFLTTKVPRADGKLVSIPVATCVRLVNVCASECAQEGDFHIRMYQIKVVEWLMFTHERRWWEP